VRRRAVYLILFSFVLTGIAVLIRGAPRGIGVKKDIAFLFVVAIVFVCSCIMQGIHILLGHTKNGGTEQWQDCVRHPLKVEAHSKTWKSVRVE
jgi:hypothetical protein